MAIHEFRSSPSSVEPVVYRCMLDQNLPPGARFGPVIRDVVIVECCEAGRGSVIINGREFPVYAGDCYILLPGDTIIHTADEVEPRSGIWCALGGMSLPTQLRDAGITAETPFAPPEAFSPLTGILYRMIESNGETDPGAPLRRTGLVYEMLGELLRYGGRRSQPSLWIKRALGILESQYNEEWTVHALAAEVGLERSYFSTLFHTETGMTPHAYLSALRIRKACTLLRQPGSRIAEVAESVGIPPENFARLFRREMGVSPREWQKKM